MNIRSCCPVVLLGALFVAPAAPALDYQLHGFAAQGLVYSEGNNVRGHSTEGSVAFNEFGVNGTAVLAPGLLLSAQGLVRDAGKTDDDRLRLDYALLDYEFWNRSGINGGVRLGRVRNTFGLYNETRDLVFTRPGILLPESVYFDGLGFRGVLFASNGGQLYGGLTLGDHYLSAIAGHGLDRRLDDLDRRQLTGGMDLPVDIDFNNLWYGRVLDDVDGGIWRFGMSYLHGVIEIDPKPGVPISGDLGFNIWVLSAQHNGANWRVTGEYSLMAERGSSSLGGPTDNKGDGLYVQGDYFLTPQWTLMARYDLSYGDRTDRDGRSFAAATGADRYSRFARDATVGVKWLPDAHWGVWTEYHRIEGTSAVSAIENLGRTPDDHWGMALLMVGYHF